MDQRWGFVASGAAALGRLDIRLKACSLLLELKLKDVEGRRTLTGEPEVSREARPLSGA